MLTISKALSAGQARTYHSREFTSEKQNYWSRDQQAHSEWQGTLAREWGLRGEVGSEHFARLSEGQHPESGVQLVKHQPARTYENESRQRNHQCRASCRLGCDILCAEVRLSHCACWR